MHATIPPHASLGNALSLLQDIVDNTSSVIYVKDLAGRYMLVNRQFEELFHTTRTDVVGKTDYDLFPVDLAEAFRANDHHVAETQQLLECEEIAPHADGPHTYLSAKFPLFDAVGHLYAVAGISTDVTDRLRWTREIDSLRHRTSLLLESVGDGICGISRLGQIDFVNPAAERLLAWPVAELVGQPHTCLWPASNRRHADDPVASVLKNGERQRIEQADLLRKDGTRLPVEYTISPIFDQSEIVGAVLAFRDLRERIARQRADQELQAASHVQAFLYPQCAPNIPGFDVAGMTFPSERVCGDYFDFQPWADDAWCLALGDVSGHGLGPALHMVETRAVLRSVLLETTDPGEVLLRMNRILSQDLPEGMFVTLFVGRLEPQSRRLTYASAGHPAGLWRSDGSVERLQSAGFPLGMFLTATYETAPTMSFGADDILVVVTDGIAEMRCPQQTLFGWDRQSAIVRQHGHASATEIAEAQYQAARQFAQGEPQHDDVTLIVAKCLA